VVEGELRLGRHEVARVVAERRHGVPVLHEVARGARECVAAHEPCCLRDAVHAIARLGGQLDGYLGCAELRAYDVNRKSGEKISERAFARVDGEEADQAIDRCQQNEPFRPEGDSLSVQAKARRAKAGLMQGDSFEQGSKARG
jgi:hypothetical protein